MVSQALGMKLQSFGHRVRIASHKQYRQIVLDVGLEYYPLGGDPKVLSECAPAETRTALVAQTPCSLPF